MTDRIGLVLFGFGRVGQATLELALSRPWLEVRGVVARSAANDGRAARTVVAAAPLDLRVSTNAAHTLGRAKPDVVIVATSSRLADVLPTLRDAVGSGARAVLCTAEELAFVDPGASAEAGKIHALAVSGGTSIVATGVNPGFVFDLLPIVLSGIAWDVTSIRARRVVDVSVFAPHVRRRLGIGHPEAAFDASVAAGSITGHLGFPESLRALAASMGVEVDEVRMGIRPIVAEMRYELSDGTIEPGTTIGTTQHAEAIVHGSAWLTLEMVLHAAPASAGIRPIDEVHVSGRSEIHAVIDPGSPAVMSTAAQLINGIPAAMTAAPGVYGPGALPPSSPWLSSAVPSQQRRPAVWVA